MLFEPWVEGGTAAPSSPLMMAVIWCESLSRNSVSCSESFVWSLRSAETPSGVQITNADAFAQKVTQDTKNVAETQQVGTTSSTNWCFSEKIDEMQFLATEKSVCMVAYELCKVRTTTSE